MSKPFIPINRPIILDVGGGTGEWSRPYRLAGYDVRTIDPGTFPYLTAEQYTDRYFIQSEGDGPWHPPVRGVLLAPPCTEFAGSGARWWAGKDPELLRDAVAVVRSMLRLVELVQPEWWALENPVGRLARSVPELGKHRYTWQPWQYGDDESKRTCMWGEHAQPRPSVLVKPKHVDQRVWRMGPSPLRQVLRSVTPPGYAQAFFEANQ